MNDEEVREQPEAEPADVFDKTCGESAESDSGSLNNDTKSNVCLGKFKSAEDLLTAYNNLQAEFTRKCQKLSEFEKEKTSEKNLSEEEMDDKLSKFLLENADAKNYSDQLKQKVREGQGAGDPFENAWAKIILERLSDKSTQKTNDPLVKKYVFEDEELRNKVIECYIKDLNANKPPILLSSESGERATKLDPVAPKTLKDAKKLVEDMFS